MKLIHVAFILRPRAGKSTLYLRKVSEQLYTWFEESNETEIEIEALSAQTIEEAMRLAHRNLKEFSFSTLNCGFRYTLPERDEHGINALFWQMGASYSAPGGVYFDEEVGHNCFVQNSSHNALKMWRKLKELQKV
jgi:hypothetical protein